MNFKSFLRPTGLLFLVALSACAQVPQAVDTNLWLEEIESERALAWVRAHNEKSLQQLTSTLRYTEIENQIRTIVLAKDRVPGPQLHGGWIYNFWQDAAHVRGLWRRTRPEEYAKPDPSWENILDLDALAKSENENWVWRGARPLPPACDRWLVLFSRGGKDANVVREFDMPSRSFVKDGFSLPEAKSKVAWTDANTLFVSTDFGPGSMTESGYPRQVRLWKRGTDLAKAALLLEADPKSVSAGGYTSFRPEGNTSFVGLSKNFYDSETYIFSGGKLHKVPFPTDASFQGVFHGHLLATLRSEWKASRGTFLAGAFVSMPLSDLAEGSTDRVEALYVPGPRTSLNDISMTKSYLYLTVLDNVKGRLLRVVRSATGWISEPVDLPDHGVADVIAVDDFDDRLIVRYENFLKPSTMYLIDGKERRPLKMLPERFDARDMVVEQMEAVSTDGERIPYFVVHKKDFSLDGNHPTLLYGYGGFEIPQTPAYMGVVGKIWLEKGGVYVLANIRGGGEFGPRWHQAAQKEKRQHAFDDFLSVAEDLIRRKITSPRRLGIMGGSNGGLLVGACLTQRPELFNAVVCEVPLLDMSRYHKLLAGASWIGEYGDPDDPAMAEALMKYSPYHHVRRDVAYPRALFITSTKDDRVHPGHARKMVARMEEQDHDVLYFENIEGGHGGAANLDQRIKKTALEFTYLFKQLFD